MTYYETLTTVKPDGHAERTQKQYDNVEGALRSAYTRMSQFMDASVYVSVCSRVCDTMENEFEKFVWVAETKAGDEKTETTETTTETK